MKNIGLYLLLKLVITTIILIIIILVVLSFLYSFIYRWDNTGNSFFITLYHTIIRANNSHVFSHSLGYMNHQILSGIYYNIIMSLFAMVIVIVFGLTIGERRAFYDSRLGNSKFKQKFWRCSCGL